MALGALPRQARFECPSELLGERLRGIYRFLADYGDVLSPFDYFADLYSGSRFGQPTVPARVVATVMLLQPHEGLSDREATDRLERDLAWQTAAGVHTGYEAFHPTPLAGVGNRLREPALVRGVQMPLLYRPGLGLIDEVAATAGNVADREAVDELLAPVADLPEKREIFGDSAYAGGETLEHLEDQGFPVTAKVPRLWAKTAVSARTTSLSTWPPAPSPARPARPPYPLPEGRF